MNSSVSPLLNVVKTDVQGKQKTATSSGDSGFSDSFREARNEYDKAHKHDRSQDSRPVKEAHTHQEKEPARTDKTASSSETAAEQQAAKPLKKEGGSTEKALVNESAKTNTDQAAEATSGEAQPELSLANLTPESSVEDILSVLRSAIESGDLEQLESILSPEEIAELTALLEEGNELPLNATVISALEAVKQAVHHLAALDKNTTESAIAGASRGKEALLKQDGATQAAESALTEKAATSTVIDNTLKAGVNNAGAVATTEGPVMKEGAIKQALEGELGTLADNQSPKVASSRLVNELLGPQPASTAPAINKPQLSVATPFQQAQWGEAVAERVMWMSSKGIQEAEIHLDPPELGPLQVKVSVANEQAHVSFVVQHGSVREALDQSAMRLREMFEGENIDLVDVDVSDQSEQFADSEQEPSAAAGMGEEGDAVESETALHLSKDGYSLISTYA